MEHKNRWLTRLDLVKLEDRVQLSTLLSTGLDEDVLADVFTRPHRQQSTSITKQLKDSDEVQIVPPKVGAASVVTAPTTRLATNETTKVSNAVLRAPAASRGEQVQLGDRIVTRERSIDEKYSATIIPFSGGHTRGTGELSPGPVSSGDEGTAGGVRALNFAGYDTPGSSRQDVVLAVAPGNGPHAGDIYTAGGIARGATLKRYDGATGALEATTNFAFTPAQRTQLTGVAVGTDGFVYVTGRDTNAAGTVVFNSYVHRVPAALGGAVGVGARLHQYPNTGAAGDVQELTDITVSAFDGDVYVTGHFNEPTAAAYRVMADFRYLPDATMTVIVEQGLDFGLDTPGNVVTADPSTGTSVLGGALFDPAGATWGALRIAIGEDTVTDLWGGGWVSSCGATAPDVDTGSWGMTVVGTDLFLTGSVVDTVDNPLEPGDGADPYDNFFVRQPTMATGTGGAYGFCYINDTALASINGIGGDWAGKDSDNIGTTMVSAAKIDIEADIAPVNARAITSGITLEVDPLGTILTFKEYGDSGVDAAYNQLTVANGITVLDGGADVGSGGSTNVPAADFTPGLSNDTTFGVTPATGGPPTDGYYASDDLPFGA